MIQLNLSRIKGGEQGSFILPKADLPVELIFPPINVFTKINFFAVILSTKDGFQAFLIFPSECEEHHHN
jgi:hypothetical protein